VIVDTLAQRQWLAQWRAAADALTEQRRRELLLLTPERALAAADALLSLALPGAMGDARRTGSGLVEWQRLIHRPPLR
jgi:hypothetical protein